MKAQNQNAQNNVAILGQGEVGQAIKQLVETKYPVFTREIDYDNIKDNPIDILHVCIPYSDKFETIIEDIINELKPRLTIINSTVKPGATQNIHQKTQANLAHTPFMGVHPVKPGKQFQHPESSQSLHLFDYFTRFTKFIGPVNQQSGQLAQDHFESLGIKTQKFNNSTETELAKILSTTYYGWNILFEKWVHSLCQQNDLEFDNVYTKYNLNYNQGYQDILPHVVRPVLKHHQGEIGGHCVIPNAEIIQDWLKDDFTGFMLDQNKKLSQ